VELVFDDLLRTHSNLDRRHITNCIEMKAYSFVLSSKQCTINTMLKKLRAYIRKKYTFLLLQLILFCNAIVLYLYAIGKGSQSTDT